MEIHATDIDDAQSRIQRIPHAKPIGELVAKVPAKYGILARMWCWVRNAIKFS